MDDHLQRALTDAEISGLVAEHHEIVGDINAVRDVEKAVMSLKDRCDRAARLGSTIGLCTVDGVTAEGVCVGAGVEYLVLEHHAAAREVFPVAHIIEIRGLPHALADHPLDRPKLTSSLRMVLRGIDGCCRIRRVDGAQLLGRIEAVGHDHIDVCTAESRQCVVPLGSVVSVWWTR